MYMNIIKKPVKSKNNFIIYVAGKVSYKISRRFFDDNTMVVTRYQESFLIY